MADLQIPEYIELNLEASAARAGQTKEQRAEAILSAHLEQELAPPDDFTDAEIARFKHSIAQLERGEVVTSEEVEERFAAFFKRQAAR